MFLRRPLSGVAGGTHRQNPNTAYPSWKLTAIVTYSDVAAPRDGNDKWRSPFRPTADDGLIRIFRNFYRSEWRRRRPISLLFYWEIRTPTQTNFVFENKNGWSPPSTPASTAFPLSQVDTFSCEAAFRKRSKCSRHNGIDRVRRHTPRAVIKLRWNNDATSLSEDNNTP